MLEKLSIHEYQEGDNLMVQSISRKDLDVAWLAGFIEGEGCIAVRWKYQTNPKYRGDSTITTHVCVYNKDMKLISEASRILKENGIKFCFTLDKRANGIDLRVFGKGSVEKLINIILPYLKGQKKEQAIATLELIEYRRQKIDRNRENGRFKGMELKEDEVVNNLIQKISDLKKPLFSGLDCSRKSNEVLSLTKNPQRLYVTPLMG